nr:immunoglobulin light chain junction region [Macaca mulatta]MOX69310.1 immunoglobulin light chain junction region [Macaca mulatta]MOX69547.1 immunoglobulin light chain junction region [Macaca mulatta]MOX70002.1 immunoglobulin light chain junction region [Macaca mulatta]MOX70456.1 immunoglobulin light chain junction region [Macaca mulatta]
DYYCSAWDPSLRTHVF